MTREEAWNLLNEFTRSDSLLRHALAVEAAMAWYAEHLGHDVETWRVVGLLHDFDYERWPQAPDHTRQGARILRERGVDEEIIAAVLSHAEWNQEEYPLDRPIRQVLYAVDELTGFIMAVAYVRPDRLAGMTPKSVLKKLKQPSFAAAVRREDIVRGAERLGIDLDRHIANVIAAMQRQAQALGLGAPAGSS